MGPAVAATFLQRALTALNRNGKDYPDLVPDGRIGAAHPAPRSTPSSSARHGRSGETVLLRALEALQGERYLRLAERRPANEAFLYGWLANRIGEALTTRAREWHELWNIRTGANDETLPPPGTFAEGQRYIYGLLAVGRAACSAAPAPSPWSRS